jgi:decaprenylphospho-beta-D-erythro-pentofuranosid-2-ulose 2-reductase
MKKDKKAMIIGATSDVGKELAVLLSKAGTDLLLTKRADEELEPLQKDLMIRYGVKVQVIDLEATDYDQHESILNPCLGDVDSVYCFIGYLGDQEVAQKSWAECARIIDLNFKGVVSVLNLVANIFEQRKSGSIIAVSSVAGNRGRQSNYYYGCAKAALTAYMSGLRNRLFKSHVHVMTVLPGFMKTKMTAHLELPALLTATPGKAAQCIYRGAAKHRNTIYVLPKWRYIMMVIISIPEFIFKRLSL